MIKPSRLPRKAYTWVAVLLLGILFAQAMTSIPRLSITFDEDLHISTGYSILRTGDLRLVEDHPPAIGLWMSWPLLLSPQIPDPWDVPEWELGDRRLFVRNEMWWSLPIDSWVIPPRIPISWLAMLMGAFLFRWACEWFGPQAGLLALALFVFDPNILAYATLATLDLGVTCFIFIATYTVQRFAQRPNWPNLVMSGVTLGLALSAKISAMVLLPINVGLIALWGFIHWRKKLVVRLLAYLSVAFLILWAVHLFGFGPTPGLSFPLPMPTYLRSFLRVGRHVATGNPTYLLGETYRGGRWYYFPAVFALKTPLPTLALLGATLLLVRPNLPRCVSLLRRIKPCRHRCHDSHLSTLARVCETHPWWRELALISLPVGYFALSMVNKINLGYRHLLPILPFVYLFIARLATPRCLLASVGTRRLSRPLVYASRFVVALLLLWQVAGTLKIGPFYITFFNEIVGGPRNGYRYLSDSNVDWGQGLKALRDYLEAQPDPDVRLSSYLFFIRPELYGIQATPLPPLADAPPIIPTPFNPAPGTYIISASTLRGLQLVANPEMYNWFWHREPDAIVVNALLVYRVAERTPTPTWLAQCSVPVTPLSPAAVTKEFGRSDLRQVSFDCTQSWLYPELGASAGWYVLHREAATSENVFINERLAQTRLSFEQKIPHETPSLTVFEWDPSEIAPTLTEDTLWAAPVEWPPAQAMTEGIPVSTPISFNGPLSFLGYEETEDGQTITLTTYWQVIDKPDRPFSLMAHIVGTEGRPVAIGDGLGVFWGDLQPGDLVVQRHLLSTPDESSPGPRWLQTGVYWLDTMERWQVVDESVAVGDRILWTLPQNGQ